MNSPPTDPTGLPQKGDLIAGKYQVEDVLGRGGMGIVVAARHLALRQRVAVKFLLPTGLSLPGARERFLREARAAAAIQSEHVARVLDVGVLETGAPFLVMEHLSGSDLSHLLKTRKRLPIAEAVDIVLQASEAIGCAHSLGIIHRDLKPGNLFVVTQGSAPFVKVLDFGLSKMKPEAEDAPEANLTATDLVIGSPYYMSPEQIRSLKHVDARTDLWALGVILYQLIAGRRPFDGGALGAVYASILSDAPVPLQTYQPDTPTQLDALVRRCLEKDPARRVQSVAELVQELLPFAPPRAPLPSQDFTQTPPSAPAKPAPPSVPIAAAITAGSTFTRSEGGGESSAPTKEQTTVRLSSWEQTQARPPTRRKALIVAAGVTAVAGTLVVGSALQLQENKGAKAVETPPPMNAPREAFTAEAIEAPAPNPSSVATAATIPSAAPAPRLGVPPPASSTEQAKAGPPASPKAAAPTPPAERQVSKTMPKPTTRQAPKSKEVQDPMASWE